MFLSTVVTPFKSIIGDEPEIENEPVISAFPSLIPFQALTTFVNPDPFPTKDPLKIDPEIALVFTRFIIELDPETVNEPVIIAFPLYGKVPNPVKPDPSPW